LHEGKIGRVVNSEDVIAVRIALLRLEVGLGKALQLRGGEGNALLKR